MTAIASTKFIIDSGSVVQLRSFKATRLKDGLLIRCFNLEQVYQGVALQLLNRILTLLGKNCVTYLVKVRYNAQLMQS